MLETGSYFIIGIINRRAAAFDKAQTGSGATINDTRSAVGCRGVGIRRRSRERLGLPAAAMSGSCDRIGRIQVNEVGDNNPLRDQEHNRQALYGARHGRPQMKSIVMTKLRWWLLSTLRACFH